MKIMTAFYIALSLLLAPLAWAAETARPAEIPGSITSEKPYGTGKLSRLMIVGYEAELWMDGDEWSYVAPFALSLRYRMGFDSAELVDRTITEMKGQGEVSAEDEARYRKMLAPAFPNVKDGDRITAVFIPRAKTRFFHNGALTGEVNDAIFAQRFFDIWLSKKTTEPSLRRDLLHVK